MGGDGADGIGEADITDFKNHPGVSEPVEGSGQLRKLILFFHRHLQGIQVPDIFPF